MENLYGKTCFFVIDNELYRGKITGHNTSEYKVRLNKSVFYKHKRTQVIYVKKRDLLFQNDMPTYIDNICSQYLMAVLSDDEYLISDTISMLSQLGKYFPKNKEIKKCIDKYVYII